jgi:antitoxin component YwqK of YwqJK toxin-antitoxin module
MRYLLILLLLAAQSAGAQWKSFTLTPKGDTMNRLDLQGRKQGPWSVHVDELRGNRGYEEEGFFENDQKEGTWKRFSLEGDLIAIESYRFGMKHGRCQYFTNSGDPLREESWRAIDPKSPFDTVPVRDVNDPNKIIRFEIVKVEPNSYKNGTWTYFNTTKGTIESTEEWVMNKPKVKDAVAGDDMAPIDVTNGGPAAKKDDKKVATKPKEVAEYEKKNAKKKIKVRDGSTGG